MLCYAYRIASHRTVIIYYYRHIHVISVGLIGYCIMDPMVMSRRVLRFEIMSGDLRTEGQTMQRAM